MGAVSEDSLRKGRDREGFKAVDRRLGVPLLRLLGAFQGRPERVPLTAGSRILVLKFSALGDTLLLLPILKALRSKIGPSGRLEVVATPVNAILLEGLPWVDRVHLVRPADFVRAPWKVAAQVRQMRAARLDWALDFDQWLRAPAVLAWASGARLRAGFETEGEAKHAAFHFRCGHRRDRHEFEQFVALAGLAGLESADVEPYHGFLLREGPFAAVGGAPTLGAAPLVVLHPGAGGARAWQREWPVERFGELARRLRGRGMRIALSGAGAHEEDLCASVERALGAPGEERCLGRSLADLAGLLKRSDLVVCGNTGVMHLAAGLGRPLVALHGPTSPTIWGPRADAVGAVAEVLSPETDCAPCLTLGFEYGCAGRACMDSIAVDVVERACVKILGVGRG